MTVYKPDQLPFWAERDSDKKLVYRLPSSVIVRKGKRNKADKIAGEVTLKYSPFHLGGFDGNGNRWLSTKSVNVFSRGSLQNEVV